jgi:hypothetical protein
MIKLYHLDSVEMIKNGGSGTLGGDQKQLVHGSRETSMIEWEEETCSEKGDTYADGKAHQ